MDVEAMQGVGESNSTRTGEQQKRRDCLRRGQLGIAQTAILEGKAIHSTEAERTKGGSEYDAGEGQFHK